MSEQKDALNAIAKRIFEASTSDSLGPTFHTIASFHLTKKFGKNPYEVFVENPVLFFSGLREILGKGADPLIILLCTFIKVKYAITYSIEDIKILFTENNSDSSKKMCALLKECAFQEKNKSCT